ncbi:MAG: YihA family ribosome biogenesis GTP-binding protein [Firmicutes bacterium]|nr:YihA family ribosome biogenesis GTP-binding protein [Candidatus Colivicinus equi]
MIQFVKSAAKLSDFPQGYKEVVFVGRSNAGKSSLINALYKKDLAYTGKTPGKTKMINFFNNDEKYLVVDVPGYGFANRSKQEAIDFGDMMEDYFSRDNIKLCVMIVDCRIGLTDDDVNMLDFLKQRKIRYIIVVNKIDKLSNNQLMNNKHKLFKDYDNCIYISTLKRTNIDILKNDIEKIL